MFFYNAVCSSSSSTIEILDFDTRFKQLLKSKSHLFFVLEAASQKTAGCAILEIRKSISVPFLYMEIELFYIDPKYRRLKGADYLYTALEDQVVLNKVHELKVNCNINSTLNQNFYTKRGFVIAQKKYKKIIY
jgi:ribosomal protein S18 acetylase RimI-like enzyme